MVMDLVTKAFTTLVSLCVVFVSNLEISSFDLNNNTLTLNCDTETLNTNITNIQNLNLNCSKPDLIYSEYLSSIKIEKLKTLTLLITPASNSNISTLNKEQLFNLNVENLILDFKYKNNTGNETFLSLHSDFIYNLDRVQSLQLRGVVLLPRDQHNETTKCTIESLRIETSNFSSITSGWLEPCNSLHYLYIAKLRQRNSSKDVRKKILQGLRNLRILEIHDCYVEDLDDEMKDLVSLQKLSVSRNQIHYALTTTVLPALEELDLSYNHIYASSLFSTGVERLTRLRSISLDYNKVLDMCDQLDYRTTVNDEPSWHVPLSGRRLNLPLLRTFSLKATITASMCFGNMNLDSLEYFDVSDSRIANIHFKSLPKTKTRRLEINVAGCPITDIPAASFTEENYNNLYHEELRITGLNVALDCDCGEHFWLARAMRERKLILDKVTCTTKEDFALVQEQRLNCTKYKCDACTCRRYWQDDSIDAECSGELQAIPKEIGLRRLYASGNLVENITAADIPDTLIYLDLRKNHIARMSADAAKQLFRNKEMKIRLLGNPIICDCANQDFILQLMDHFDQVEDYAQLLCVDGRMIQHVEPSDLCFTSSKRFTTSILVSVGTIIGVLALCGGLYYRYGQAMKVFLYSRGICLFCIKEEELDADRPFDAFISFSHSDFDFVKENLLSVLENEPYSYKICVHYRNWVPGELIPTQIDRSVEESKRTIIVLSNNFIESVWGLLEFRTAHLSALKEGRSRVIIIILDEILNDEKLDGELKSYLRTNTYVKWGDPWFWDKLRYALPHKPNVSQTVVNPEQYLSTTELSPRTTDTVSVDSAIEMEHLSSK